MQRVEKFWHSLWHRKSREAEKAEQAATARSKKEEKNGGLVEKVEPAAADRLEITRVSMPPPPPETSSPFQGKTCTHIRTPPHTRR
jgi:hypothetical protein